MSCRSLRLWVPSTDMACNEARRVPLGMWFFACVFACVACLIATPACRRGQPENSSSATAPPDAANSKKPDLLVFPDELRVADASVNDFVTQALTTCAKGDYEPFRLLWSVREDPLPRGEYEEGWHAVQTITVRALEKVMLAPDVKANRAEGETVYALLVDVSLDPTHKAGQKQPQRHVVMMLAPESGDWRLARAPTAMRAWIKEKASGADIAAKPSRDNHGN